MIWLLTALLASATVALLLRPLFSTPQRRVAREAANVAAYHQRRVELAAELDAGLLDESSHAAALAELDRRLLAEATAETVPEAGRHSARLAVVACVVMIVPLALLAYAQAGSWKVQQRVALAQTDPAAAMRVVTEDLAAALVTHPEAEGYALLGSLWAALQEPERAARAYAEANRMLETAGEPGRPDWLVAEAEMIGALQDRDLRGRPHDLLSAALALDPGHVRALWFIGIAELQQDNPTAAIAHWRRLEALGSLPAELRGLLAEQLAKLDPQGATPPLLQVTLTLAPAFAERAGPGSTLFVFARDPAGPPMPVAALRLPAPSFPLTVSLDDRHALNAARPLSGFAQVMLGARLSQGDAMAASGDIESDLEAAAPNGQHLELHLGRERR